VHEVGQLLRLYRDARSAKHNKKVGHTLLLHNVPILRYLLFLQYYIFLILVLRRICYVRRLTDFVTLIFVTYENVEEAHTYRTRSKINAWTLSSLHNPHLNTDRTLGSF